MNIIISGYGKMGKEIEKAALQRNHTIIARIDTFDDWKRLGEKDFKDTVAIDFSQPDVVENNIYSCFKYSIPVVVGTTGWNSRQAKIKDVCNEKNQSLFIASNFSIGMNLFFALNQYLAGLMNNHTNYDVSMEESHHIHKLDKPSGTAISLAEQIIQVLSRKNEWSLESDKNKTNLEIDSIREGEIFGDHSIKYTSTVDEITISHSAKSRQGFAMGAVMAAEWLAGKKGCFEMKDMLGL